MLSNSAFFAESLTRCACFFSYGRLYDVLSKRFLVTLFAVLWLSACSTASNHWHNPQQAAFNSDAMTSSLLKAGLNPARVSLYIEPLSADTPAGFVVRFNHTKPLLAASTMKLYTSAAALDLLGPQWRGQTSLAITSPPDLHGRLTTPLYIIGAANIDLNPAVLFDLLAQLHSHGVRELAGGVIFDRSRWRDSQQDTSDPWIVPFDESPRRRYNHRPDLLAIDQQMLTLQLDSQSGAISLKPVPAIRDLQITHQLISTNQPCDNLNTDLWQVHETGNAQGGITLQISGEAPADCQLSLSRAWLSRQHWAALLVRHYWLLLTANLNDGFNSDFADRHSQFQRSHNNGRSFAKPLMPLTQVFSSGVAPADARIIASHQSRSLAQLVQQINKQSDNSLSRTVFLELGATAPNAATAMDDTIVLARQRVSQWLTQQQISQQGLLLDSGAGMSRQEQTTTSSLAALIRFASQQPWYAEWLASLPRAGVDGTLQNRLTTVADRARLKTGTLKNAVALAGVVWAANQQPYIFVGIVNGEPDDSFIRRARLWLDSQVELLAMPAN